MTFTVEASINPTLPDAGAIAVLESAVELWAKGVNTFDAAKIISYELGKRVHESVVYNLLASYWADVR